MTGARVADLRRVELLLLWLDDDDRERWKTASDICQHAGVIPTRVRGYLGNSISLGRVEERKQDGRTYYRLTDKGREWIYRH